MEKSGLADAVDSFGERVSIQFLKISHAVYPEVLSKGFEMTDYLTCHFERIARNLSLLYGD
jgi:hypothetical protein